MSREYRLKEQYQSIHPHLLHNVPHQVKIWVSTFLQTEVVIASYPITILLKKYLMKGNGNFLSLTRTAKFIFVVGYASLTSFLKKGIYPTAQNISNIIYQLRNNNYLFMGGDH